MTQYPEQYLDGNTLAQKDELAVLADVIEQAIRQGELQRAADLMEKNMAATWYALPPAKTRETLGVLVNGFQGTPPLLAAAYKILTASAADLANTRELMESFDADDPRQMFVLSMFRMRDFRLHGMTVEAMEQADSAEHHIAQLRTGLDPRSGWLLDATLEIGVTAMLAGDFTRALSSLMKAQMYTTTTKFAFLERDAIVKSALIHACFGNATTAKGLIRRTKRYQRTSSWHEAHIDAHEEFVKVLTTSDSVEEALDQLEAINLQDIGEMWPFYVVALHRILEAAGHHDELDHRLEMFDSLPLPRVDGQGFSGSVIPLKRAMTSLTVGRGSEALQHLKRADHSLTYTKLVRAAANLYAGRTKQALEQAHALRKETRGFRLMEIRRLSILSTAQYMSGDTKGSIQTLTWAAALPRGLDHFEARLFSTEITSFAEQHVDTWPTISGGRPIFITELPKPGRSLTRREIQVLEYLAQGLSRAEIADRLFLSISTIKTQLRSLYRKIEVSSAAEAILEGERRGIL